MEQIALSNDLSLSRLVYGWWRLMEWQMDAAAIEQRLEHCLELGISSHDHADIYGDYGCEIAFGQALKNRPDLRDRIQLISKCGIELVSPARPAHQAHGYNTSAEHIIQSAERSLKNLHTDRLDLLLIHRPDPLMCAHHMARAFEQLHAAGKVRHFGVSNFLPHQFELLQSACPLPLVTNQIEISVLHHDAFHDGSLDQAQRLQRPPMAWSALAGGRLFAGDDSQAVAVRAALAQVARQLTAAQDREVSPDQVAIAWLLKHPARILPIVGSGDLARVRSAARSTALELNRQQWYQIWTAAGGTLP